MPSRRQRLENSEDLVPGRQRLRGSANRVFDEMAAYCQERIFRLALQITRNREDAEDVRQETLLKARRGLRTFEGRSRFTTWISRIAINESLMLLRRQRNRPLPMDMPSGEDETRTIVDHLQSPLEDPEIAYARRELNGRLRCAIDLLPSGVRLVFLLCAVEELTTRQTARILQLSPSAVKARMRRARETLRESLQTAEGNGICSRTTQAYVDASYQVAAD